MTHEDEPRDWRTLANCRASDPDTMQPEVASREDVEVAKAVCVGCPVRRECNALAASQPGGAYGVHAGKWWGDPPRRPVVTIGDELLTQLLGEGLSLRKIAAEHGLSKSQVQRMAARLSA